MKKILIKMIRVGYQNRIGLNFDYDPLMVERVKAIFNSRWEPKMKCWHIPMDAAIAYRMVELLRDHVEFVFEDEVDKEFFREFVKNHHQEIEKPVKEKVELAPLTEELANDLKKFKEWMQVMRYAEKTIESYMGCLILFFRFFNGRKPNEITADDIHRFNSKIIIIQDLSASYQNQFLSALKLFLKTIPKCSVDIDDIERPQRPKKLPIVMSQEEVIMILKNTNNIKHFTILSMIYGCGLRRGEALRIQLKDIDSKRMVLAVMQAKGNKDRMVPISKKIVKMLREYFLIYRPVLYLFEGNKQGKQYSAKSVEQVFNRARDKAGITKKVTLHSLRHSYATHLHEAGTDLRHVQVLLGHKDSRTTEIYTHVSMAKLGQIKSPLDDLDLE